MPVASELLIRIDAAWKGSDALRRAKADTDAASTATDRAKSGVQDLGRAFAVAGGAAAAAGIAAKAAFDFAEQGAQIQQLETSFERMNNEVFKTPDLLNQMRDAAGGTVSQFDLMSGVMTLVAGVSKEMAQDLAGQSPKLLEIAKAATALNPALGDTSKLYQDLATGIKRSSPLILDNLGIVVKLEEVQRNYAESIGKSVQQLTAEEKTRALLNAVIEKGNILIEQAGGSAASATDSYSNLTAELTLLKEEAAKTANEGLAPLVGGMADALRASREFQEGVASTFDQGIASAKTIEDLEKLAEKTRDVTQTGSVGEANRQMEELATAVARASTDARDFEKNIQQVLGTLGGIRAAGDDWEKFFREFERSEGIRQQKENLDAATRAAQDNATRLREIADAAAEVADGLSTVTEFTEKNTRSTYEATRAYEGWVDAANAMHQAQLDKIAEDTKAKEEADKAAARAAEEHQRAMEQQAAALRELNAASGDYFTAFDPSVEYDRAAAHYQAADAAGANARALADLAVQQGILTQAEADLKVAASDRQLAIEEAAESFAQTGDVDAYVAALDKAGQAFENYQGRVAEARNAQQAAIFDEEDPNFRIGDQATAFGELETAGTTAMSNVQTAAQEAFTSLQENATIALGGIDESLAGTQEQVSGLIGYFKDLNEEIRALPQKIKFAIEGTVNISGNAPSGTTDGIGAPAASAGFQ